MRNWILTGNGELTKNRRVFSEYNISYEDDTGAHRFDAVLSDTYVSEEFLASIGRVPIF